MFSFHNKKNNKIEDRHTQIHNTIRNKTANQHENCFLVYNL